MKEARNAAPVTGQGKGFGRKASRLLEVSLSGLLGTFSLAGGPAALGQTSVLTAHNDIARTGQNLGETLLTTANVNPSQFGKLFSQPVVGQVFAQPLYVPQVTIPGKGVHNVVYVATHNDYVYAYDADSNGGIDAAPLWQVSLLTNTAPAGTYSLVRGVTGTPVIDASTSSSDPARQTMFLVSSDMQGTAPIFRLHALDITTGAEKFGGPFPIQATVNGTGSGSTGGKLAFDPLYHLQRSGLLLLNGVVYVPFASVNDVGPWHGWIFSFNVAKSSTTNALALQQLSVFCTTPNGSGGGVWMGGAGLAAEVNNPAKPYGRMFVATGNGSFGIGSPTVTGQPFGNPQNAYSMSVLDLDLTNGQMTVEDTFTPFNQSMLDGQDGDLGSGGPVLLPRETTAAGKSLDGLVQVGKSGMIYLLNRDDNNDGSNNAPNPYSPAGLGGFNSTSDQVVGEVQTPIGGAQGWGAGIWGSPAYWNGSLYFGGTSPGLSNPLTAYSYVKGALSAAPTSKSNEQFIYPAPTPSISANGQTNGIVWVKDNHAYVGGGSAALLAYDATNLGNLLYSSNANVARDNPGPAVPFTTPTIANGKVYTGETNLINVFGLLASAPTAPPPVISPASGSFSGSQTVTIADSIGGATIYYTTDGSVPTVASTVYGGPFKISSSVTITAIASPTGYLQSAPASATLTSTSNTANPVFSLAGGTYSGSQSLTITDATAGATIHCTVDGTTPTASSPVCGSISVAVTETIKAIATSPSLLPSTVVAASYTINPLYNINFTQGFTSAQSSGLVKFNGSTDLDDFRLQLTNGGTFEAGSAFYTTPVNVQAFTTDFTFQLSNPVADGFTFTIQGVGPTALGGNGSGLGYATIAKSVAVKFDMYSNAGEGTNSTGLYTNGALPTVPAIDLSSSPISLHSGDYINAHLTYDGVNLTITLTNPISLQSWSYSWPINIPATVGGNSAYVGFTGGTGAKTSSQKITYWTYVSGLPALPNFPVGFDSAYLLYYTGAWLNGTNVQLTSGGPSEINSVFFYAPVDIETFTADFDFRIKPGLSSPLGDGFTFTIQNVGPGAIGGAGGGLGYAGIPHSMAIKFDLFNNAGEGTDSTGIYFNGAAPTVPSLNLANNNVNIGSGDLIHAHITYDGTIVTWRLQDMSAPDPEIFSNSYAVNLPNAIGSNTAYVGFTAASATGTAVQSVLDWTFNNTP